MVKLYNTYKKKKVNFYPVKEGKVKIYCCGPTVYDDITIGNIQKYVFDDILRRTMEYLGYEVTQVMNITDVGHLTMTDIAKEIYKDKYGKEADVTDDEEGLDRMEKAAKREGISVWEVAQKYIDRIFGKNGDKDNEYYNEGHLGKMNILRPHHIPRATNYINEQIEFIKRLEEKGYTYKTKHAVYFDILKFPKYEKIVGQKFSEMKKGERADSSDPHRKHPADFRLWQLNQPEHAMQWDSPWGRGYPGWHIECSTMSRIFLGQPFDIHTGGEDHIRLHHACEMAQSESAYGKPMANYWMHNRFVTVNGMRMGKSLGNAYILNDIIDKGFDPMDLRYFYLQTLYRKSCNFTWEKLEVTRNARKTLVSNILKVKENVKAGYRKVRKIEENDSFKLWEKRFINAIKDDLNIPNALGVMWKMLKSDIINELKINLVKSWDSVFGLRLMEDINKKNLSKDEIAEINKLIIKRNKARERSNWKEADEIREKLKSKYNVVLQDTKAGTLWEIKR